MSSNTTNERACINCEKIFDSFKISLHEPGCIRNYQKCSECKELIEKEEYDDHFKTHNGNSNNVQSANKINIAEQPIKLKDKKEEIPEVFKRGISSIVENRPNNSKIDEVSNINDSKISVNKNSIITNLQNENKNIENDIITDKNENKSILKNDINTKQSDNNHNQANIKGDKNKQDKEITNNKIIDKKINEKVNNSILHKDNNKIISNKNLNLNQNSIKPSTKIIDEKINSINTSVVKKDESIKNSKESKIKDLASNANNTKTINKDNKINSKIDYSSKDTSKITQKNENTKNVLNDNTNNVNILESNVIINHFNYNTGKVEEFNTCRFCQLNLSCNQDLKDHEVLCGSRTIKCEVCQSLIVIINYNEHRKNCKSIIKEVKHNENVNLINTNSNNHKMPIGKVKYDTNYKNKDKDKDKKANQIQPSVTKITKVERNTNDLYFNKAYNKKHEFIENKRDINKKIQHEDYIDDDSLFKKLQMEEDEKYAKELINELAENEKKLNENTKKLLGKYNVENIKKQELIKNKEKELIKKLKIEEEKEKELIKKREKDLLIKYDEENKRILMEQEYKTKKLIESMSKENSKNQINDEEYIKRLLDEEKRKFNKNSKDVSKNNLPKHDYNYDRFNNDINKKEMNLDELYALQLQNELNDENYYG